MRSMPLPAVGSRTVVWCVMPPRSEARYAKGAGVEYAWFSIEVDVRVFKDGWRS